MLLKLLKYDFRAMWKSFSLIWGAALALAVVNRFTITGRWSTSLVGENTSYAALFALFLVFAAMFVIASIFVIQRFSRGLLGDEGYLMHTLPVQPWQLVVSKLICALAVWIASGVVAVLSMLVMAPVNFLEMLQYPIWQALFRGIMSHPDVLAYLAETCLVIVSLMVLGFSTLYLAMSLGHLSPRWKGLASVAAFIVLDIAVNLYGGEVSDRFSFCLERHTGLWMAVLAVSLPAALCLAGTCWILTHKLNLE